MQSIYSSKLYIASPRKERIDSALNAAANLGLVQQLADDLDEEYQTPKNLGIEEPKQDVTDNVPEEEDNVSFDEFMPDDDEGSNFNPKSDLVTLDSMRDSFGDEIDQLSEEHEPTSEGSESAPVNEEPKELSEKPSDVATSTDIDLNAIKGGLNSVEDTAGVIRVGRKENEIWIYYNDDTDLNDIMTNVIEYMSNAGYVSLEFNRLARSNNAIVFEEKIQSDVSPKSIA